MKDLQTYEEYKAEAISEYKQCKYDIKSLTDELLRPSYEKYKKGLCRSYGFLGHRFTTGKAVGHPIVTYCPGCNMETLWKDKAQKIGIFCESCGSWMHFREYKKSDWVA